MIYCVVPPELEAELYDKLVEHYSDNPDVTVIIDRRSGPNRRQAKATAEVQQQRSSAIAGAPARPGCS